LEADFMPKGLGPPLFCGLSSFCSDRTTDSYVLSPRPSCCNLKLLTLNESSESAVSELTYNNVTVVVSAIVTPQLSHRV
jgi:hypothetical protein